MAEPLSLVQADGADAGVAHGAGVDELDLTLEWRTGQTYEGELE
jgi:hypothetical protein